MAELNNTIVKGNLRVTSQTNAEEFVENGTALANKYLQLSGGTLSGQLNASNIIPNATNSYPLGNNAKQWSSIWGQTIYENGTALVNKYLGINGIAKRADNAGYTWDGIITIGTWSRLCKLNLTSVSGGSCLFTVKGTRGSVVYQGTFLIQSSHASSDTVSILLLSSSNYTSTKLRAIASQYGTECFIEILDSAAGSGTQTVNCTVLPLTKETSAPETYTTYQAGEIPSGYFSEEITFGEAHTIKSQRPLYLGSGGTSSSDSSSDIKFRVYGAMMKQENYGKYFEFGVHDGNWCYLTSSVDFYMNKDLYMVGTVRPTTADTYDLGVSTRQWNNIYGKTIYENGTALSSKYLAKTGGTLTGNIYINHTNYTTRPGLLINKSGAVFGIGADGGGGNNIRYGATSGDDWATVDSAMTHRFDGSIYEDGTALASKYVDFSSAQTISGSKTFTATDTIISGNGFSTSNNLLNNSNVYACMRSNSSNPFFGLKYGSTNYYLQATSNGLFLGPTSSVATSWDSSGNMNIKGTVQAEKDITLYTSSGDSPRLTFRRGTLTDTLNDWSLYDSGGYLYIQQRGSSSSAWETRATFTQSGVSFAGSISEGGTALSSKYLAKSAFSLSGTTLTLTL